MAHYKISDVAEEVKDRENNPSESKYDRFVGLEHYVSGDVEITHFGSTERLESAMKVFKAGDILIARRNVYLKRASTVSFDGLTSGDSIVLRAKDPTIARILPFVLNTDDFWDYADQYSDGTMSKRLSPKLLLAYEFDLPDDGLEDFADLLWAANETRNSYRELLRQTDELVKSQFIEMFGDPETNPMNWEHMTLSSIVTNSNNGITRRGNDADGQIVLRIAELQDGYIDYSDVNRIVTKEKEQKCLLVDRDLLFVRVNGNPDYVARSAVFEDIGEAVYHNDHIIRMHIDEKRASVIFARGFITSDYGRKQLKDNVKTSAGQYSISQDGIGRIQIYLPPLEEQERYVKFVQQSDKSKFELKQAIERVTNLMKSLMQQDFAN